MQFLVATNVPDVSTLQPSLVSGLNRPSQDSLTEYTLTPDDFTIDPSNGPSNDSFTTETSAPRDITQSAASSAALTYPKKPTHLVSADLLQEHIQTGKRVRK